MQVSKEGLSKVLRRLRADEKETLMRFFRGLGLELRDVGISWRNLYLLEVRGAKYFDVMEISDDLMSLIADPGLFYTGGLYIGLLFRLRSSLGFKPGLPLARRLSSLCGNKLSCFVLDERGERIFLYGRPVPERLVVKFSNRKLSVVVNNRGEPLGWGRVEFKGRFKRLVPVVDLGWYLRRGG